MRNYKFSLRRDPVSIKTMAQILFVVFAIAVMLAVPTTIVFFTIYLLRGVEKRV